MRDVFASTVKDDRVSVADGEFTATGVAASSADLIVIAQVSGLRRPSVTMAHSS